MYRRRKVNLLGGLNIYTTLRSIENVYLQFSKTIFSSKKYNTSTFKYPAIISKPESIHGIPTFALN